MGKLNALLAQASAAISPEWDSAEETRADAGSALELENDRDVTTRDEGWETETRAARADNRQGPPGAEDTQRAAPPTPVAAETAAPPAVPEPVETPAPPVLKVVDPLPVLKVVERLHQGVREDLRAVTVVAKQQQDYLREVQRAHNAMTTSWYEVAEGLPTVRAELNRLRGEIAAGQTEVTAVREQAEEETRVALTMQARELEAVLRRVRRAATRAVLLVALVGLLAVIAVAVVATGALHGLHPHLHRPL